jgi:hypothetical protein
MNRPATVGAILLSKGYAAEAIPFLKRGAWTKERVPELAPLVNLGAAYRWTNDFNSAEAAFAKAVPFHPKSPELWGNYAMLLEDMGDFSAAHKANLKALHFAPDNPQVCLNAAYSYLRQSDWEKGWPLFERRPVEAGAYPNLPRWTGKESLKGKRLLIVPEGGYGDAIYFARWLPRIWSLLPASITMLMWDDLVSLLECLTGAQPNFILESEGVNLLQVGEPGISPERTTLAYDYFVPLMSLAACLGGSANNIPCADQSYFSVEPEEFPEGPWRIGVCLSAEENGTQRPHRSVPSALWSIVKKDDKIRWYNLQQNLAVNDYSTVFAGGINPKGDWLATARLIAGLDLVISVDTAVLHLAGALGLPTWALIPHRSDWKWGLPSKWTKPYPHLRYFYQDELVSWKPTLRKVRKALTWRILQ